MFPCHSTGAFSAASGSPPHHNQIFLVSARDALFSRLVLRPGGASQEALDTFRK